jgi:hypothetical protein
MSMDVTNRVIALCAAGMDVEGTPDKARPLFEQAWALRSDDYDASIAAHFLARHQATPEDTLRWNSLAVQHAEAVPDGRANDLMASLYLNLADSYAATGRRVEALDTAHKAHESLALLPQSGYRDFVAMGIQRLQGRLGSVDDSAAKA